MANAAKAKGSTYERRVCDMLNAAGVVAERMPAGATLDRGDLWVPSWTVECKNQRRHDLAGWMDETLCEQANRASPWHVLFIHRAGRGDPAHGYAVMTAGQAVEIMAAVS